MRKSPKRSSKKKSDETQTRTVNLIALWTAVISLISAVIALIEILIQ